MPKRIEIMEKREIIRRLLSGCSLRSIERETGITRPTIRDIKALMQKNGWSSPENIPTEHELSEQLKTTGLPRKESPMMPIVEKIKEWRKDDMTYVVMRRMINRELGTAFSDSKIRRFVKEHVPVPRRPIVRRDFNPGEVAEIDFGYCGLMSVAGHSKPRKVWVFSMRPCFSKDAYRELVFDQNMDTFFKCHMHAFEYFGGVYWKIVCDNLKAAVIKASREDPLLNRAYVMMAEYYGFLISACLPRTPEHKGGVEKDVDYFKRNFLSEFTALQKQKGYSYPAYEEAVESYAVWKTDVDDVRRIKYLDKTPKELFAEEKDFLKELPTTRWDIVKWYNPTVGDDWKIQVAKGFYSVPHEHIGTKVWAYLNSSTITIFHDSKQIAWHFKVEHPWQKRIVPSHGPENYKEYLTMTSTGIRTWARFKGPEVLEIVEAILRQKGIDGLRPAKSMMGLEKKYGLDRLKSACRRAVATLNMQYQSVKNILAEGLDLEPSLGQNMITFNSNEKFRFDRSDEYKTL
jgi:transposase